MVGDAMRAAISVTLALLALGAATGCGSATGAAASSSPSPQPPQWLLERMARTAQNAGDSQASAWWALTTAEKAIVVSGEAGSPQNADSQRAVYVVVLHGDFTNWLWSLPADTAAPDYSWIDELIDADSHSVYSGGASAAPVDTDGLDMHTAALPATSQ